MKRVGVVCILVLAFAGLADSTYLAQHEASGEPLLCNIQNLSGCNVVVASEYSRVFGISLAEYGVFFYSVLFVLAALELVIFDRFLRRVLQVISFIGVVSSLYFIIVQMFFIGAFCIYCLASAIITLIIFICAGFIEPMKKNSKNALPPTIAPSPSTKESKYLRMPPVS